jgi:hypothetical protein
MQTRSGRTVRPTQKVREAAPVRRRARNVPVQAPVHIPAQAQLNLHPNLHPFGDMDDFDNMLDMLIDDEHVPIAAAVAPPPAPAPAPAPALPNALRGPPYQPAPVNYPRTNRANFRSWEGNKPGEKKGRNNPAYRTSDVEHSRVRKCPYVETVPAYKRCMPVWKYKKRLEQIQG